MEILVVKLERALARQKEQIKALKQTGSTPAKAARTTTKKPTKPARGRSASASAAPAARRGRKPKIAARDNVSGASMTADEEHEDAS